MAFDRVQQKSESPLVQSSGVNGMVEMVGGTEGEVLEFNSKVEKYKFSKNSKEKG